MRGERLTYRPLVASDLDAVPLEHQGTRAEVLARIEALGASALLAFDGDQHVGQLQFRRFQPGVRSPSGVMDPLYWGDFSEASLPRLPAATLNLFCYHVGQLRKGPERDPRYLGRGIGAGLLDALLAWAATAGFDAVIAKAVPPYRPVAEFMGGHPVDVYAQRGFRVVARWLDRDLRATLDRVVAGELDVPQRASLRGLVDEGLDLDAAAEVAACVLGMDSPLEEWHSSVSTRPRRRSS